MRRLLPFLLLAACAPQPPRLTSDCAHPSPRDFGCDVPRNLAAIADPADLSRGRAGGATPGALDAAALQRLRDGKTAALKGAGASDSFQRQGGPQ